MWALLNLAVLLAGVGLALMALRYRTPEHPPIPTWDPRRWTPVWKQRSWYRGPGYRFLIWGLNLIVLSAVMAEIRWWK